MTALFTEQCTSPSLFSRFEVTRGDSNRSLKNCGFLYDTVFSQSSATGSFPGPDDQLAVAVDVLPLACFLQFPWMRPGVSQLKQSTSEIETSVGSLLWGLSDPELSAAKKYCIMFVYILLQLLQNIRNLSSAHHSFLPP